MYYIGIDPGLNGGITVLNTRKEIEFKTTMPLVKGKTKEYDIKEIHTILTKYKNGFTVLEKSQPHFRDGSKQAFKTGFGFGVLQALLVSLNINHMIIAPKIWQSDILKGLNTDDTKQASITYCKRRWSNEDWTATERSKKDHDGLTDATCLALYAQKQ